MQIRNTADMAEAISLISVRASKIRSLCIGAREAFKNLPPLQDERAKEWATVGQDLIEYMEDELSFLLEEVKQAEKTAIRRE